MVKIIVAQWQKLQGAELVKSGVLRNLIAMTISLPWLIQEQAWIKM